jgi:ligand-binding sensor domain-containing protein
MKHLIFILLALLLPKLTQSQSSEEMRVGEWKSHFSFNQAFEIIETKDKIIAATKLGLVMVGKNDYSIHTYTKVNGLSDYNITALCYNSSNSSVLIGYENGNIDIIKDNRIININDLKTKQLDGGKRINHFLAQGEDTYVATDFGIMVLDIDKREISSTYYIGKNATNLTIHQLAFDDSYFYAATEAGVRRALKDAPNIHIYEAWKVVSTDQSNYSNILQFSDGVVFSRGIKGGANTLLYLNNDMVQTIASVNNFYKMDAAGDNLIVTSSSSIQIYNTAFTLAEEIKNPVIGEDELTPAYRDAIISADNSVWLADNTHGILNKTQGNTWVKYLPHGPFSNKAHQLKFSGEKLWLVPGGLAEFWNNAKISASLSVLSNDGWQHLTTQTDSLFKQARDLLSLSPNPENPDQLFVSSWGNGLFEINAAGSKPTVVENYLTPANGLVNIFNDNRKYVRVATTAFDQNNTLWMTNSMVENAIVAYLPREGKWQRYSYGAISDNMGMAPMMAASTGDMWLSVFRGNAKGLFVWNDNNTPLNQSDDIYRSRISKAEDADNRNQGQLLLWDDKGIEITNSIYSMAEDQNGHIWLGTDEGIVVQYQPSSVFTREKPIFSRIKIARGDGSARADFLLDGQIVSSILVDPGNRKWLGTQGSGVYLVSPDGTKQISAFNTDNSPLPSNYINSIAINEKTGEIFFATGEGVISYKGSATQGNDTYAEMYAFPNPVRPDFSGNITITGLVAQTTVKITDVSGKLVFETTSVGGQAFWNGKNLWGETVKSGIYLVFVASEDGSQSAVTKIAIIR